MPFDQPTRNRLQKFVSEARATLTAEFTRQLQNEYGLDPTSGLAAHHDGLNYQDDARRQTGRILRETLIHYHEAEQAARTDKKQKNAGAQTLDEKVDRIPVADRIPLLERIAREHAFTILNRLAALRMAESRGLLIESLAEGYNSKGFQLYAHLAGSGLGERGDAYRCYLCSLFDEFALDLRVLFDRFAPNGRLFPRESALLEILSLMNDPAIAPLWAEDETIGWIYQYFNSKEERKKMRDESAAPRNSRELAVRNQFFTPRYVVEFLTDNTLGRIWYEMRQGQTRLAEQCRYLVRRPDEVFLASPTSPEGEAAQGWLQGQREDEPGLWPLAHTVDGYARSGGAGEPSNLYVDARLPRLASRESVAEMKTQELLDLLFLFCRKDRFCEGTLDDLKAEIERIRDVLRDRIAAARRQDASQEELLKQPVFIPHRPRKDPREIRVLDPACGSMHFGLYAFDLLETIYEEAWDLDAAHIESAELKPLRDCYAHREAFLRDVPRLIIEHNLHGIDIDPRAVQIAGLSLWLRAQRSWQQQGIKAAERPQVRKSNIVCAEPMPGDEALLEEFIEQHLSATSEFRVIAHLVRQVFQAMKLAGEAGSLLKIEEEVAIAVAEAKTKRLALSQQPEQQSFLDDIPKYEQQKLYSDLANISDESFWDQAETSIYEALRDYAGQSENGGGFQRQLFMDDAKEGFAFIDICRKKYEVVLMNPPFGDASLPSKSHLDEIYADTKGDVYKAFVECFQDRLRPGCMLGIISSRTGFFLGQSADWRERIVLRLYRPLVLLDLGIGVLDAMVETAAYVLRSLTDKEDFALTKQLAHFLSDLQMNTQGAFSTKIYTGGRGLKPHQAVQELRRLQVSGYIEPVAGSTSQWLIKADTVSQFNAPSSEVFPPLVCLRLLADNNKEAVLPHVLNGVHDDRRFVVYPEKFRIIPNTPFAYWVSKKVRGLFADYESLSSIGIHAGKGPDTGDDFRFLRLSWEVSLSRIGPNNRWVNHPKGGEFARFYSDVHLVIDWQEDGELISLYGNMRNRDYFYRPGITWSRRTTSDFSPRIMPAGCIFGDKGPAAIIRADARDDVLCILSLMNSSIFQELMKLQLGTASAAAKSYEVGVLQRMPIPPLDSESHRLTELAQQSINIKMHRYSFDETAHLFSTPALLQLNIDQLRAGVETFKRRVEEYDQDFSILKAEIDDIAFRLYGIDARDRHAIEQSIESKRPAVQNEFVPEVESGDSDERLLTDQRELIVAIIFYLFGCSVARWDIRFATGEKPAPELPDPFAPLPVCPPGMLQNEQGLPATPADVLSSYPLRITWPGILVDDKGHAEDIERRVREALQVIWADRADAIEQEACEILDVKTLRDYFRKPASFFADHLKRYSKSRRQAPIYWPLSTRSGEYTLWLYYHRLDDQTLYACVNNFVEPKLRQVGETVNQLRGKGAGRSREEEKEFERMQDFEQELQTFRDELLRLAKLPWRPNLNDGVQITAAPLWPLFRLPKWQKTLKETWQSLEKGDYDWAHLAMTIWPERVVPKCTKDRSLAIAHDVEDLFWVEDEGRWRALQSPKQEREEQKRRQRTPARERARHLLSEWAGGEAGGLSAAALADRLAAGAYDDGDLALLLYPERMGARCWAEPVLAERLGLKLPAKKTKAARDKFIKQIVADGCADLAPMLEAALAGRETGWADFWQALAAGAHDALPIALALWPDRVVEGCAEDFSLAEAHGLQQFFWVRHPGDAWRRRLPIDEEIANEIVRRR